MRLVLKFSKHTVTLIVNQSCGEYKVRHEDLVPYYNVTIYMAERFRNFTSTMYLASRTRMRMHWHLSLLH